MAKDYEEGGYRLGSRRVERDDTDEDEGSLSKPASDLGVGRMARQKEELSNQMSGAVGEMERLKMRQDALEREKQELQHLADKQREYESGKRSIMERLGKSTVLLEKEEAQASRMASLYVETRERFEELLEDLRTINEEKWAESDFAGELDHAVAQVETAQTVYKKALAKIDASSWHKQSAFGRADRSEPATPGAKQGHGFGYWLKVGLAASLPLIVVMIVLFVAYLYTSGFWTGI